MRCIKSILYDDGPNSIAGKQEVVQFKDNRNKNSWFIRKYGEWYPQYGGSYDVRFSDFLEVAYKKRYPDDTTM